MNPKFPDCIFIKENRTIPSLHCLSYKINRDPIYFLFLVHDKLTCLITLLLPF